MHNLSGAVPITELSKISFRLINNFSVRNHEKTLMGKVVWAGSLVRSPGSLGDIVSTQMQYLLVVTGKQNLGWTQSE